MNDSRQKRIRGIGARILVFLLGLLVALLLLEGALRLSGRMVKSGINTNAVREHPEKLEGVDFIIACFGDSHTYGVGATSKETAFPARLEKILSMRYPDLKVRVFNHGVPGTNSSQHIKIMKRILPEYPRPPDVVFFLSFGSNQWNLDESSAVEEGYAILPEDKQMFVNVEKTKIGKLAVLLRLFGWERLKSLFLKPNPPGGPIIGEPVEGGPAPMGAGPGGPGPAGQVGSGPPLVGSGFSAHPPIDPAHGGPVPGVQVPVGPGFKEASPTDSAPGDLPPLGPVPGGPTPGDIVASDGPSPSEATKREFVIEPSPLLDVHVPAERHFLEAWVRHDMQEVKTLIEQAGARLLFGLYMFRPENDFIRDIMKDASVSFCEAPAAPEEKEEVWSIELEHPNDLGYKKMAESIADCLAQKQLIPPSPHP